MELLALSSLREQINQYVRVARTVNQNATAATLIDVNNRQLDQWLSSKEVPIFDIFLSHAFKDAEIVAGIMIELTKMGYLVYVDWVFDAHLNRETVSKSTAELLTKRMKRSKSLLYATTENATHSKWMPWELGFKHGENGKCAILPVKERAYESDSFKGQEYLGVYKKALEYRSRLWICPDTLSQLSECKSFDRWARTTAAKRQPLRGLSITL